MDIEHLREFVEFCMTMNFTAAAQELHLSQSSLTRHMQSLEQEIGTPLVLRGSMGMPNVLTPAGIRFREFAAKVVGQYEGVLADCRELAAAPDPVRIQDVRHVVNVISQLRRMLAAHGGQAGGFSFVKTLLPAFDALDRDEVDFALLFQPSPSISVLDIESFARTYASIPLNPEVLVALAPASSPFYARATITPEQLAGCTILRGDTPFFEETHQVIAAVFAREGYRLTFRTVGDRPLEGGAYPMADNDINLCTKRFAQYYADLDAEDFSILAVEGFEPTIFPFLVCRKDNRSPLVRALLEAFTSVETC